MHYKSSVMMLIGILALVSMAGMASASYWTVVQQAGVTQEGPSWAPVQQAGVEAHGGTWIVAQNIHLTQSPMAGMGIGVEKYVWLLIFSLVPIILAFYLGKLGYLLGTALMLVIFSATMTNFVWVMVVGFICIGISFYKGGFR